MADTTNGDTLLQIKDLKVQYTSGNETIHAVNGVSFDVRVGETLGLVGETGAGKTTIAKSIMSILPDVSAKIKNGKIFFYGQDLLKMPETSLRKIRGNKISMIFQDPMTALNPVFTVGRQIAEVIRLHEKLSKKESYNKAVKMLETVGINGERAVEYPHQFSGGMKQRVVIAMALACNHTLLIADEPTTALDVTIQAQVLELIGNLKERFRTSMILITHDLGVVAEVCDNVAVIYAGEIVEIGTNEDIFDHPVHPYTIGLFNALPMFSVDQHRLTSIKGLTPNPADLPSGCKFHPRCPHAARECSGEIPEMVEVNPGHFSRCNITRNGIH